MRVIRGQGIQFIAASHEDPKRPGVLKRVLATKDELFPGRVQMINWALLPRGSSFQNHYHEDMEEIFVITAGEVMVTVDSVSEHLGRGDAIVISPNERHQMKNTGQADAEYLVIGISGTKNGKTVLA